MAVFALAVLSHPVQGQVKDDVLLPEYTAVQGVTGALKIIGSDTMKHEMALLTEGFKKFYPSVGVEIEGKGSSSAPPALLSGAAQFAPMSRAMKAEEVNDFKKKFGYRPVALATSIDMLAVFVHKDNPLQGLTLQQVDALFSSTRKGGYIKSVNTWGDLGLEGEWADKPITFYGRNAISGTHLFFREHALFNGAFRSEVKEQPDSPSVVEHVAGDRYAVGYSGIGFKSAAVRALPLALDIKSEYFDAEPDNAYSGNYPLTRMLFLYVNHPPGREMDLLRREFIRYLYSQQGQADVVRSGYLPVGNLIATRALASVDYKLWSAAAQTPATTPTPIDKPSLAPIAGPALAPIAGPAVARGDEAAQLPTADWDEHQLNTAEKCSAQEDHRSHGGRKHRLRDRRKRGHALP